MAQSYVTYAGNGTTKTFTVPFEYLDKTHVKVYVNGTLTTAFTWPSAGQITFTSAPASGAVILIRRETPSTSLIDFTSRARWQTSDLNLSNKQSLFRAVEAIETATKWAVGTAAPTVKDTDVQGDNYLNVSTGEVYTRGVSSWTLVGSIKGATGATGAAGPTGPAGATGATGAAGAAGSAWFTGTSDPVSGLGSNGDYYLKQSDGGVYAKAGGSWYLITNIKGPTGLTGAQGAQGPQGPQGAQGVQGVKGDTGSQGIQGIQGLKGDTGAGVPTGGAPGQFLIKKTSADFDYEWNTPSGSGDMLKSIYDSNGDGIVDQASAAPWAGITGKPSTFTPSAHIHAISDVTSLQSTLDGKAAASHTHTIANITNLQTTLDGKASSTHAHIIADVTGLQTALDGKAATTHTHAIADVTNLQTTLNGKASTTHTHAIADVTNLQTTLDALAAGSGGGATGGGTNKVFFENDIVVSANYTITSGKNAMTAGPVTINSGVTVTVGTGQVWTIV
jgi:hypothetical protein